MGLFSRGPRVPDPPEGPPSGWEGHRGKWTGWTASGGRRGAGWVIPPGGRPLETPEQEEDRIMRSEDER